jgi:allantoate deiminase
MDPRAARIMERIAILAAISEEPDRLTRRCLTPALAQATGVVAEWMRAAGLVVRRDTVGNVIGRYEGDRAGARTLLLGSHLDTVRDAGPFDGPLGVLTALAAVEGLRERGARLPFAIETLAFADEEGLRYHTAYLGSKAFTGSLDPAYLDLADADGVTMREAIRAAGGDPAAIPGEARAVNDLLGYCEVHIEQGPVLEARDLPVGVVSAIAGQSRIEVTFTGEAGHAGTVPMDARHDALCAAASFILVVEAVARRQGRAVATVGQLALEPGASNVIPGRVTLSLDVRHPHDDARVEIGHQLREQADRIGGTRGVAVSWRALQETAAVACDPPLSKLLAGAVESLGVPAHLLPSGAGHDAVIMARIAPIAMLFVRCRGGVSHNPAERATPADVAVALHALDAFLQALARRERGASPPADGNA